MKKNIKGTKMYIENFEKLFKSFIFFPKVTTTADKKIINVYLKNSEGCMVMKSKLTHL